MTGAEPQVSGCPCFLPEVLVSGDEVTATTVPGLSPSPGPLASSPAVIATSPAQSVLSFTIPHPSISGPLSPGER